jgi:predicted enzyme related to lactoylglutathione lyase
VSQPLVHFEIIGKDAAALRNFYAELLGWKIAEPIPDMGNYCLIDGESSGLAGGIGEDPDGGARVSVYAGVPDLQATLDQAVALGGKVLMEPTDIPGGPSIAMFADPAGNVTGLVKQ